MSNLTVGLAILGGVVLCGVILHGVWTTRKNAPKVLTTEHAGLSDDLVSPGEVRQEPRLDDLAIGGSLSPAETPVMGDPAHTVPTVGLSQHPAADRKLSLDALIDVIAPIQVDHAVSGDAAVVHLPPTRRAGSKPFAIEGRNLQTGLWETPVAARYYDAFHAGLQLANRAGAVNEIEFSEFMQKASAFADAVDGTVQAPDMKDSVARARELDAFAASHDAQLSVSIRARQAAWSAGFVQLHAARQGFVMGTAPGRMVMPAAQAGLPPVLVLQLDPIAVNAEDPSQTAMRSVVMSLDVPTVSRAEQPFVRMRDAAIALAAAMDGTITDERGAVLMADTLDAIGADLEVLYDALQDRDLAAGSPQARRLFS